MDYYCDVCLRILKAKNKYKLFKSKSHIEIDKCKHILIYREDIDTKDIDEAIYLYIIEHNEKFDYYLVKCEFNLAINDYQYCPYVTSKLSDKKTTSCSSVFFKKIFSDFKDKGYTFNHIAEMHIITIANKLDMSYEFYIKHNMCALEWKLNAMMNKGKSLINKFDRNWKHPLNGNFESYRV